MDCIGLESESADELSAADLAYRSLNLTVIKVHNSLSLPLLSYVTLLLFNANIFPKNVVTTARIMSFHTVFYNIIHSVTTLPTVQCVPGKNL